MNFAGTGQTVPVPAAGCRCFHIREDDSLDEAQLADRVKQASALPGETM